ncbi:MAG TPA: glycosyltransferase [Nocardioidaceae bacterium]|nr:glycosyltransferase [Nocardioidaceae bacterium]
MDDARAASRAPRLLLIAYHYPPRQTIASHRTEAFARHLRDLGWDVRIVTSALGGADDAHVFRVPHIRRRDRLRRRRVDAFDATVSAVPVGGQTRIRRVVSVIRREFFDYPDREGGWARSIAAVTPAALSPWTPDLILASGPPFSTFVAARRLASRLGAPWIADYRDEWTYGWYYERTGLRRRMDRWLEHRVIDSARAVLGTSTILTAELAQQFGKPAYEIRNGFEVLPPEDIIESQESASPLRLVYTGELNPTKRDPRPLFRALRELDLGPEDIQVDFYGATSAGLTSIVAEQGVGALVRLHARVPTEEAIRIQASADVLLLLTWDDPRDSGYYAAKLFEYLAARRPILMLGYASGVAANLLRERQAGFVSTDPQAISQFIAAELNGKRSRGRRPPLPKSTYHGLSRREQSRRLDLVLRHHLTHSDLLDLPTSQSIGDST